MSNVNTNTTSNTAYMVTDYTLSGESFGSADIESSVSYGPMNEEDARKRFSELADGLAYNWELEYSARHYDKKLVFAVELELVSLDEDGDVYDTIECIDVAEYAYRDHEAHERDPQDC